MNYAIFFSYIGALDVKKPSQHRHHRKHKMAIAVSGITWLAVLQVRCSCVSVCTCVLSILFGIWWAAFIGFSGKITAPTIFQFGHFSKLNSTIATIASIWAIVGMVWLPPWTNSCSLTIFFKPAAYETRDALESFSSVAASGFWRAPTHTFWLAQNEFIIFFLFNFFHRY